jgi:hypothetical protein
MLAESLSCRWGIQLVEMSPDGGTGCHLKELVMTRCAAPERMDQVRRAAVRAS